MRLVTYQTADGDSKPGVILENDMGLLDLQAAAVMRGFSHKNVFESMLSIVRSGQVILDEIYSLIADHDESCRVSMADVSLLAPLPIPEQMRCYSAFEDHVRLSGEAMMHKVAFESDDPDTTLVELKESGQFNVPPQFYERPFYYKGNRFSVVGPNVEIEWPENSDLIDYELEVAVIIGKKGKNITRNTVDEHIFGYALFNDFTARDTQQSDLKAPMGFGKSKDFDGSNVLGPWIVTKDDLQDIKGLSATIKINGELVAENTFQEMYFSFQDLIIFTSQSETLHPGEIFTSGCVGLGSGFEVGRLINRGDTVAFDVTQLGRLENKIIQQSMKVK